MTEAEIKFIISRVIDNANDAIEEAKQNKDAEFNSGKIFAYYEILDTIKNELIVREQDLKDFGLDIDLERKFL